MKEGFPDGPVVKNPPASASNVCSVPESGRSPGEGNGNSFQYSCLENLMDSMKRQKDITSEEEPSLRLEGIQYATGEEQREITNSSRNNEVAGPRKT